MFSSCRHLLAVTWFTCHLILLPSIILPSKMEKPPSGNPEVSVIMMWFRCSVVWKLLLRWQAILHGISMYGGDFRKLLFLSVLFLHHIIRHYCRFDGNMGIESILSLLPCAFSASNLTFSFWWQPGNSESENKCKSLKLSNFLIYVPAHPLIFTFLSLASSASLWDIHLCERACQLTTWADLMLHG